jgi:hypothetical protein
VFAAVGAGAGARVDALRLDPALRWVASPRHAELLLVAGDLRAADRPAVELLHDQLPPGRRTLWWGATPWPSAAGSQATLPLDSDPVTLALALQREGRAGHAGEPEWLPDQPPSPWRGIGEHGQGGKGMMGGKPYGRPMAMTDDDLRDGLQLDAYRLELGPFWPGLPAGLLLELTLQGDVIQRARVLHAAYVDDVAGVHDGEGTGCGPTRQPHSTDRQGQRLRCLARLLELVQLPGQAQRCRRLAYSGRAAGGRGLSSMERRLLRANMRFALPAGLGRCAAVPAAGSARDRVFHWLEEDDRDPAGPAPEAHGADLPPLAQWLRGLEWNEAMLVVASFTPMELARIAQPEPAHDDAGAA